MTLRQARILSSETDNTIKQEQNTNVNIKISKPIAAPERPQTVPLYPNVQPLNNVNFTQANQPTDTSQAGVISDSIHSPMTQMNMSYQFQPPINNNCQGICERGIADIGAEINELDKKNKFLEMIIEMYESNPLKINSRVVCESKLLMDMIKLLTECDKVELVLNDDIGCSGCTGKDKFIYISKILITKDNKTEDMKYAYNDIYSQFIKYGVSLKVVV